MVEKGGSLRGKQLQPMLSFGRRAAMNFVETNQIDHILLCSTCSRSKSFCH